ncbi:MAG: hypothetical protein R3B70_27960 [Polyangiaceae bacterium]
MELVSFEDLSEDYFVDMQDPFEVYLNPADNFMSAGGIAGGTMPAVMSGHFAAIDPLSPGDHVLELGGKVCQNKHTVIFQTSATYLLHVED